eukprot:1062387-Amphidinium_carterae.1
MEQGESLVAWAVRCGGTVSGKVSFLEPVSSKDRVCRAKAAIKEDEVLLKLPRELVFEVPPDSSGPAPLGVPLELLEALRPHIWIDSPTP